MTQWCQQQPLKVASHRIAADNIIKGQSQAISSVVFTTADDRLSDKFQ